MPRLNGHDLEPAILNPAADFEHENLDNSKARRVLGWAPKYTLRQGLAEAVDWYREHLD